LAADLKDFNTLGLTVSYQGPTQGHDQAIPATGPTPASTNPTTQKATYPISVTLNGGLTTSISGPGLLLGIQGWLFSGRRVGLIDSVGIPDRGNGVVTKVSLTDNSTHRINMTRGSDDFITFADIDSVGAAVYSLQPDGSWKRDENKGKTDPKIASPVSMMTGTMDSPLYAATNDPLKLDLLQSFQAIQAFMPAAMLPVLQSYPAQVIIVEKDHDGQYLCFAITLLKEGNKYFASGYAFTLTKSPYPPAHKT
jgi:hypothetical protein